MEVDILVSVNPCPENWVLKQGETSTALLYRPTFWAALHGNI